MSALPTTFFGWVGFILDKYGTLFLSGVGVTLLVAITGTVIGFVIGLLVAILRTIPVAPRDPWFKRVPLKVLSALLNVYIEVFRGTPMIVQAMVIYYGSMQMGPAHACAGGGGAHRVGQYRRVHGRNRARRHHQREQGPEGGRLRHRHDALAEHGARGAAAGRAQHHALHRQRVRGQYQGFQRAQRDFRQRIVLHEQVRRGHVPALL